MVAARDDSASSAPDLAAPRRCRRRTRRLPPDSRTSGRSRGSGPVPRHARRRGRPRGDARRESGRALRRRPHACPPGSARPRDGRRPRAVGACRRRHARRARRRRGTPRRTARGPGSASRLRWRPAEARGTGAAAACGGAVAVRHATAQSARTARRRVRIPEDVTPVPRSSPPGPMRPPGAPRRRTTSRPLCLSAHLRAARAIATR